MTQAAEALERELVRDLETLAERIARDEEFCGDLYRALTNNRWVKDGGPEGHVSLSWSRAEGLVNDVPVRQGEEPLPLAQTGGDGELSAGHLAQPESPPPPPEGGREWEREAHEQADEYLAENPAKAVDRTRDARAD